MRPSVDMPGGQPFGHAGRDYIGGNEFSDILGYIGAQTPRNAMSSPKGLRT